MKVQLFFLWLKIIIVMPASELFILLSGAVLLPVKKSMKEFYKSRLQKLLPPFLFWSIVTAVVYGISSDLSFIQLMNDIVAIPFKPIIYYFWFIYVIIGLYLVAPIISPWIIQASKKQIEFILILWFISLLIPIWNLFSPIQFDYEGNYNYTLYYFSGFLGYWVLGYYLNKYPIKLNLNYRLVICVIFFVLYFLVLYYVHKNELMNYSLLSNLQIGSALYVILIFTLFQQIKIGDNLNNYVIRIAKCSFGIYLVHALIIKLIVFPLISMSGFNVILGNILGCLLTFILSYIIINLISKIPYLNKLIGM